MTLLLLWLACAHPVRPMGTAPATDPWSQAQRPATPSAYDRCASCHMPSGTGRVDGSIPRLAGQRSTYLEARLVALADGQGNPVMTPFARSLSTVERGQLALLVEQMPAPSEIGHGSGLESAASVDRCEACHGPQGRGGVDPAVPVLAGQHYGWLVHRLELFAADAEDHPVMGPVAASLTSEELAAVSDHFSRVAP